MIFFNIVKNFTNFDFEKLCLPGQKLLWTTISRKKNGRDRPWSSADLGANHTLNHNRTLGVRGESDE